MTTKTKSKASKKYTAKGPKIDAYTKVTNQIIAAIEGGKDGKNWHMPWHTNKSIYGAPLMFPKRSNGEFYQGSNVLALWAAGNNMSAASGQWGTFKQWLDLGHPVMKGQKSQAVVVKAIIKDKENPKGGTTSEFCGMCAYAVFNADQCTDTVIESEPQISDSERKSDLDAFIAHTRADITHGGNRAFYRPSSHTITLPNFVNFDSYQDYYSTACHELVHWTAKLVDRQTGSTKKDYAFEELVAELGAAFLCARLGITNEPRDDHAEYIANWLQSLRNDKKFIFRASKLAQQAVEYLMKGFETPEKVAA